MAGFPIISRQPRHIASTPAQIRTLLASTSSRL
jgi:hypothetical protein